MITQKDLKSAEIVIYGRGLCSQKLSLERANTHLNLSYSSRTTSST